MVDSLKPATESKKARIKTCFSRWQKHNCWYCITLTKIRWVSIHICTFSTEHFGWFCFNRNLKNAKLKLCLRRQTQFIDDWFCISWIQKWRSLKNTTFAQGTMRQWVHFAYVFTGTFPMGSSGSHSPRNTSCDSHTSYSNTEYSTECCEDHILLPRPMALLVCMLAAQ